ncbi:MAG: DNA mismatch repair endonuclease MutL, partial [Desulfobacteraceae bacterium]|nr:DNA mismatch repair endonuclease MutL [Desulfobacteraceae bacterium]
MNVIRILPEKIASQIAAGEVIDRPASVVRELIDNSIDAGADRVVINIEKGGKGLIKVIDNGAGMSRDDLLLSLERHATSKIANASDLFSVKSLGFRGEALPSIASVSRMVITSRPQDQIVGHKLKIAGGKLTAIEETGAPSGTIVEVRTLFFNIPARRKFLRAVRTETYHIIDMVSRAAMPFPQIGFRLDDTGKSVLNLPASDQQLSRISVLMGRGFAEEIIDRHERNDKLAISVYLAPSHLARSRGDRLFVYVNRRYIRDRLVTKAVMEGYGQRLMKGKYPQAIIFIEIDPAMVDVNVHPAKQEVRFHNSRAVFDGIASTIEKALAHSSPVFLGSRPGNGTENLDRPQKANYVSEPLWNYAQTIPGPQRPAGAEEDAWLGKNEDVQILGQLGNTYILCQVKDGFLMVDQHAAHERIVYEDLKKTLGAAQIEGQILLMPYKLELTVREKGIVLQKGNQLSHFGIELDHFGGNTFLLRSVPAILKDVRWDVFLSELITELGEGELEDDAVLNKVLTIMACHGAIRAGYRMTHEEMSDLLKQLEVTDLPTNCPHGRPTFKHFTYSEIERMFKRIV